MWRADGPGRRAMPLPRLELRARRGAPPRTALRGRPQLRAGRHGPAAVAACRVGWMGLRQHRWPGRPVRGPPRCLRSVDRGWQCERLVAASHEYDLQANWKIALENYHECYHCPLIHPELCEVSHSDSGDNFQEVNGAGRRGHGPRDHAETMSLDGRSGSRDARPGRAPAPAGAVRQPVPQPAGELHPDYVSDPPHRPRHAGHEPGRVPVAVPA